MSLELAVLGPALLLIIALLISAGRTSVANGSVQQAAADAARAASVARSSFTAEQSARETASASLSAQGIQCTSLEISVDTDGFAVPVGVNASVGATITCHVRLSDLLVPGWPGGRTVTATAFSPLDTYRGRS